MGDQARLPYRWELHPIAPQYVRDQLSPLLFENKFEEAAALARTEQLWWSQFSFNNSQIDRIDQQRAFWTGVLAAVDPMMLRQKHQREAAKQRRKRAKEKRRDDTR